MSASAPTPPAVAMPMVAPLDMPVDASAVWAWVMALVGSVVDVPGAEVREDATTATALAGVDEATRILVGSDTMLLGRMLLDRMLLSSPRVEVLLSSGNGFRLVTRVVGSPSGDVVVIEILVTGVVDDAAGAPTAAVEVVCGAAAALVFVLDAVVAVVSADVA